MEEKDENLVEEIKKLQDELKEYKDAYLRKNAEFNTFVTRKKEEFEREKKTVLEKFFIKLLEIKDDFELSLQHAENSENFKKGVEIIVSKLNDLVINEGIEELPVEGEFNPEIHDGVAIGENYDLQNNHIIQFFTKGYKFNGRVIIPAKVMVNKIQQNINNEGDDSNE